ncbi:MAG TPA: VWA domain-containing protein [Vicinamibacterales bacterium]|nr:VWA domain-containing protein [Vicinamibacterales bacterium]
MTARTFCRGTLLLAVAAAVVSGPRLAARSYAPSDKSIFVSVLDESGKPVKDIVAEDLRLREDGTDREIVSVNPAAQPLQVVVLVDTTDGAAELTQDIRSSINGFIQHLHTASPDAAVSLMEFGQAAVTAIPFSTSNDDLQKALNRLVPKPNANSVLLEAIHQASDDLAKRPSPRRAIVSLNVEPSDEQSREDPNRVRDSLRKSVAQLWSVSLQRSAISTKMSNSSAQSGQKINAKRDVVLQAFTKSTGGDRQMIVGQSAILTLLQSYADALTSQYEVTYKRPSGSAQVVQVGSVRPGVKLHASGFAPQ